MKKVFIIWIGWIGVSAVARYYKSIWWEVCWSDKADSDLLKKLENEWIKIYLWHDWENLDDDSDLIIYSEAIITKPDLSKEENLLANPVLAKAKKLWIKNISYPEALAEIVNSKKCIAVSWTHWKSTTSSMLWIMLSWWETNASVIVWTQVPQLNNSNFFYWTWEYFVIEACEYKRSFLKYNPFITIITNIELDHLDYYKDLEDYLNAFKSIQDQTSGYMILNGEDENCMKLKDESKKQTFVYEKYFIKDWVKYYFPELNLQIPGSHIEFDAKLAFVVWDILWLDENYIVEKLNSYKWAWRRSEIIRETSNWNILISDYGHHPTEISLTLDVIKWKYNNKRLFVAFQPHQYSRTIELLEEFKTCFDSADNLVIPDIYFSRDKKEDVEFMTTERFISELNKNYPIAINWNWLENTSEIIKDYDKKNPHSSIILLLWAGNIDDLRNKII
ncbi:MAG: UDP-N-acetylmuramate-L-alanine ligase [uncultured bacterium (gcode 4)]|uniref:UDP-N-acetylmuramate-L-alanine ligase n=1 Tax=uncultured bacterium (gcode 4) TaxID=1234023 RepID=K2FWT2_9BACT|nr:MAG: UDP-N-acetylmuramate-L-alanine ligase [uncultured bacterium (gcode 4)]